LVPPATSSCSVTALRLINGLKKQIMGALAKRRCEKIK
jgi:hypothetical protein